MAALSFASFRLFAVGLLCLAVWWLFLSLAAVVLALAGVQAFGLCSFLFATLVLHFLNLSPFGFRCSYSLGICLPGAFAYCRPGLRILILLRFVIVA